MPSKYIKVADLPPVEAIVIEYRPLQKNGKRRHRSRREMTEIWRLEAVKEQPDV